MQNFRLITDAIDPAPLLAQIEANPQFWNYDDSWTRHKPSGVAIYNTDAIVLWYNEGLDWATWARPALSVFTAAEPIVTAVMRAIPGSPLGKIIITRLRPGERIEPHEDKWPEGLPLYWHRYQIPLSVAPGCLFHCGDEALFMPPGTAWWFNNQRTHSVVNDSDEDRISMLCDIRPWSRS